MNETTRWIMIILLLLLIGAAVFMLLRSPGKDNGNELRQSDADRDGVPDGKESRGMDTARPERGVYDQAAEDRVLADDDRDRGFERDTTAGLDDDRDSRDRMTGAAQIGAMGAAGGAAGGATASHADERAQADAVAAEETGYEPAAGAYESGSTTYADEASLGETYRGDSTTYPETADADDSTYVDETSRPMTTDQSYEAVPSDAAHAQDPGYADAPTADETDDDGGMRMRDAAAIGAAGAAGTGAAAAGASAVRRDEPELEAPGHHDQLRTGEDEAGYAADTTAYRDESAAYTGEAGAEVHPLTDDEVHEGARTEPLTADEVVAASDDRGGDEYPVGDDSTTYRADNGQAVAMDETRAVDRDVQDRAVYTDRDVQDRDAQDRDAQDRDAQGWDAPAAGGAAGATFAEAAYGPGSAEPLEDGSGPAGWEIKGNAGSMLFHTPDSPSYDGVRAEVWFESEEAARNAGFAHWDRRRR